MRNSGKTVRAAVTSVKNYLPGSYETGLKNWGFQMLRTASMFLTLKNTGQGFRQAMKKESNIPFLRQVSGNRK